MLRYKVIPDPVAKAELTAKLQELVRLVAARNDTRTASVAIASTAAPFTVRRYCRNARLPP